MKTFNKVISLATVMVLVLSLFAIPVFADGMALCPRVGDVGGEKVSVVYYADDALSKVATSVKEGDTVYAALTLELPLKTLASFDLTYSVSNATIEGETDKFALAKFEREVDENKGYNTYNKVTKTSGNIYISPKDSTTYDSPTADPSVVNKEFAALSVDKLPLAVYTLTAGTAGTKISFAKKSGTGLYIGVYDEDEEACIETPCDIADAGLTVTDGGSTPAEKQVSFKATFDETKEYSHKLSATELEDAIAKDITVVKTVDGTQGTDNIIADLKVDFDHDNHKFTIKFANGVGEGEVLATGAAATATFTYKLTEAVVDYTYDHVEFNGAKVEGGRVETAYDAKYLDDTTLKNAFVVYGKKTVDGVATEEVVAVPTDIGNVTLGRSATSNDVSIFVHFKGTNITSITLGFTNIPTTYSNAKATLTGSPFANNTTAENVKNAVAVTATKTYGKVVTNDVPMEKDRDYEVTIAPDTDPLTSGDYTATVTAVAGGKLNGLTIENGTIEFAVADAVYTYKNYAIKYDQREFNATDDKAYISSKVKVVADKYEGETLVAAEEPVTATNYIFDIDEDGNITITFKAESSHSGAPTLKGSVTLKDVIEYRNVKATMSTRMFPAGTADDVIKKALTITADKYVNNVLDGAEQSTLPAEEYTVTVETVDTNNKKVKITYSPKCISVADAYKEFAVAVGITANAKITLSPAGTVNKGEDFNAAISVEGLGTNEVYAAEIKISANTGTGIGTLVSFTPAAGYDKHSEDMENGTVTVIRNTSGTATNILGTFTIKAAADKDAEIVVKVETLKLTTVEGDDIANLLPFTGDEERITVTEVVVPTTAKINASFDIKTLGDVTSAKDKFKAGLKVTKGTDAVTLGADNVVVTEKKVELKDLEVEAGVYKVSVDVPGYTKAEVEIKVAYDAESNTMKVDYGTITGEEAIYAGDVNGNGIIDAVDYADLVAKIGQAVSENKNCDLYTKDGEAVINLNDVITMVYEFETYFGKSFSTSGLILE